MSDRVLFSLLAAIAVIMIGFAAVWPQGFGARSPGPFGHAPIVRALAAPDTIARKLNLDAVSAAPPPAASAPSGLRPSQ